MHQTDRALKARGRLCLHYLCRTHFKRYLDTLTQDFEFFLSYLGNFCVLSGLIWRWESESFPIIFLMALPPNIKPLQAITQSLVMLFPNSECIGPPHHLAFVHKSAGMWPWILALMQLSIRTKQERKGLKSDKCWLGKVYNQVILIDTAWNGVVGLTNGQQKRF